MSAWGHGGGGGNPPAPPTPYNAQFDATYNPSGVQTNTTWGGGGSGHGGHGGGGWGYESESSFDPTGLMALVYNYKQRGLDAALTRQQRAEQEARRGASWQAQALQSNFSGADPALNAAIARAQSQQGMTAVPFTPAGAVADYYQYSRGGK